MVQWEAKQAAKAAGTRGKGKGKTAPDAAKPKAVAGGAAQRTLRLDGSLQAATKHGAAPSPATHASTGSGVDHSFLTFQNLCNRVAAVSSHTEKTRLIRDLITNGTSGDGFTGDVYLVMRLMLPVNPKRVYNMKDKQLVKAFSEIFGCDPNDMHHHLENGDCPDVGIPCIPCSPNPLYVTEYDDSSVVPTTPDPSSVTEYDALSVVPTTHLFL